MRPKSVMLVAGEASGDILAAELVRALREEMVADKTIASEFQQPLHASLEPRFFGAGGQRMAAEGVELAFDMTEHAVIGLWEPIKAFWKFRRMFKRLYAAALDWQPDIVIFVDFGGFNLALSGALRRHITRRRDWFHNWQPKLVQYVSPQVWASRPWRARKISRNYDLVLSTLPFEKKWYATRNPELCVEWVGHPICDRYQGRCPSPVVRPLNQAATTANVILLPGSRPGELRRHVPLVAEVAARLRQGRSATFRMIVPNDRAAAVATELLGKSSDIQVQVGKLDEALANADLALTKSGTITLECALFGVPAVVFYVTSPITYAAGRLLANVKYISMPNLLADEPVFPEFIQGAAQPERIAAAASELLGDGTRRTMVKNRLADLVVHLGRPGTSYRAARKIRELLRPGAS